MKNKVRLLLLLCCLLFALQSLYSQNRDSNYINSVCDSIMKAFVNAKYSNAVQVLKRNSLIEDYKVDTLELTIPQVMSNITPAYGKAVSYKFVLQQQAGDIIKKRYYILMLEKYFLKFDFTWYKAAKGWAIIHFNFDEDITDILH